jgi:NitT/TauT family transport system permease protein
MSLRLARHAVILETVPPPAPWKTVVAMIVGALAGGAILFALYGAVMTLKTLTMPELVSTLQGAAATFGRVLVSLAISALWTIPAGVAIGFNPKLARIAQPFAQLAASVPATALFPVLLLALIRMGGGLGVGSILLMLLGTQWYVLFNVIAGASAVPSDLKEAMDNLGVHGVERWRRLILPAIFPAYITGAITAAGGAWNATIVAEIVYYNHRTLVAKGLGAFIAQHTGELPALFAGLLVMSFYVTAINALLWRRMYRLAETKFALA